jgi:hypothetical protein
VVLESTRADHENGNIPKSSILALADCAYHVAVAEYVPRSVKRTLLDMVFRLYLDLRKSGKFDRYATVLLTAVAERRSYRGDDRQYLSILGGVFDQEEREYRIKNSADHVAELKTALGRFGTRR